MDVPYLSLADLEPLFRPLRYYEETLKEIDAA
jgi:hypothetical protein